MKTHLFQKNMVPWNKGLKGYNSNVRRTEEWKKKISQSQIGQIRGYRGEKHHNWKGGKSTERHKVLNMGLHKEWRNKVFSRDNFTCVECGTKGQYLQADHIKPWCLFPELRFDVSNGRTLCRDCHYKIGWNIFRENNPKKRFKNNITYTDSGKGTISSVVKT